jgi:hypothetical protein
LTAWARNLVNLSPGMAVTVEVKTGSRAIITYLLSPFVQYKAGELEGEIVATSFAAEKCRQDRVDDASPITRISCQNMLRTVDPGREWPMLSALAKFRFSAHLIAQSPLMEIRDCKMR